MSIIEDALKDELRKELVKNVDVKALVKKLSPKIIKIVEAKILKEFEEADYSHIAEDAISAISSKPVEDHLNKVLKKVFGGK